VRDVPDGFAIMTIDEIIENFSFLDDWDDRYR
jgi:sulfur transfer protein SufE